MIRFMAVFLLICSVYPAGKEITVTVTGASDGIGGAAEERAVEDALRNAVEKGFGVYVSSATLTENAALISDDVLAEIKGFVRSYNVLEKKENEGITEVKVRADISLDRIWESDSLKMLLNRMGMPRFAIRSRETAVNGQKLSAPAAHQLMDRLTACGFLLVGQCEIIEKDQEEIDWSRPLPDAELIVWVKGETNFRKEGDVMGKPMSFYDGRVNVQVYQTDSRQLLSSVSGKGIKASIEDIAAMNGALTTAAEDCHEMLVRQILEAWTQILNMGQILEIEVKGTNLTGLSSVMEKLRTIEGLHGLKSRGYSTGTGVLMAQSKLKAMDLAEMMERLLSNTLRVENVSPSKIVVRVK